MLATRNEGETEIQTASTPTRRNSSLIIAGDGQIFPAQGGLCYSVSVSTVAFWGLVYSVSWCFLSVTKREGLSVKGDSESF